MDSQEFLKLFPEKVFLNQAAKILGMERDAYVDLLCASLNERSDGGLSESGLKLEAALRPHLPSRL